MNSGFALFLAFAIGVVAGLRSMTAPANVAWEAHLGWISLSGSHLAFMGSAWAVGIFTLGALAEFVADQLPTTPARTTAGPLAARIVMGSLTGACLAHRWRCVTLAGGVDRGDRRNSRRVRRLSGSRRTGSRPSRSGYCDCDSRRPDRSRIGTVSSFQILKVARRVLRSHARRCANVSQVSMQFSSDYADFELTETFPRSA